MTLERPSLQKAGALHLCGLINPINLIDLIYPIYLIDLISHSPLGFRR